MSLDSLHYLFLRRPRIDYVSPPVCEAEFSSSSGPTIILSARNRRFGPTGFEYFVLNGRIFLRWNNYPGAICFSLYKAVDEEDPFGDFVLVAECLTDNPFDVTDFGPGTYRLTAITLDGETEISELVTVPPPGFEACIDTPGPASPTGPTAFEITEEIEWPAVAVEGPYETVGPFDQPAQTLETDYPPGHYDVGYVSGITTEAGQYFVCFAWLADDIWPGPTVFLGFDQFSSSLAAFIYNVDTSVFEPFENCFEATGATNAAEGAAAAQVYFNTPGARHRFRHLERHENLGGPIKFVYSSFDDLDAGSELDLVLRLVQVDGLIQQPRGVRIVNWAAVGPLFPGEVFNNWNGEFPARTEYTQNTCVWTAAPNGAFGGATLVYSQVHPTAPNGCGWILQVNHSPLEIIWEGFKKIGDTGEGVYFRAADSPTLEPLCLEIEEIP